MITEAVTIFSGLTITISSLGIGVVIGMFSPFIFNSPNTDMKTKLITGGVIATDILLLFTGGFLTYKGISEFM